MIPWTDDWQLDEASFERHVQGAIDLNYRCIYLMGTAGEGYAMSDGRFANVVKAFAKQTVGKGLDPQIGVISLSMETVIERIKFARDQGIEMFQISMPTWGTLDESEAMLYFETVCGSFPDCRFLHYNLPRAGRIIGGAEYRRIADAVPNLVATKNSSTDYDRTKNLMDHAGDLQHFFLEGNYALGCTIGECSLLCSYDALFPQTTWDFYEAGKRGDMPEVFRLARFFNDVHSLLYAHCGRTMIDGSYDKTFVWLVDPEFSPRVLPPYIGMSDAELKTCRAVYEAHFAQVP